MMENKYLAVDDYMLNKASYKIKNLLGIWKFDDAEVLIDMDYKLYLFEKYCDIIDMFNRRWW